MALTDIVKPISQVAGLLGTAVGGSTPNPSQVPLDPDTQALYNENIAIASRPTSDFANDLNQGVSERAATVGGYIPKSSDSSGVNPAMQSAISSAYGKQAGRAIGQIKEQNSVNAEFQKANKLNQMASAALHQNAMKIQNMQMLADAQMQNEMARAQFVSSLAGVAGTAYGMQRAKSFNRAPGQGGGSFNIPSPSAGNTGFENDEFNPGLS